MVETKKDRILFIDDEQSNLRVFKSTFRWDYEIFTAVSAKEASAIIYNEPIDLIITDQRMPGMTGVQFLESILDDFPDVPKILITGYSDVESIIDAVNKVKIFQYITKPWNKEQVQQVIENAIEDAQLKIRNEKLLSSLKDSNIQLKNVLKELDNFIYKASHDLMSPITSILGLVNLSRLEVSTEEKDQYLTKIGATAKRMKYFLSHLSIVNMIQDKNIELKKVNLVGMLQQYTLYSRDSFKIIVDVDGEIECFTDEVLLNIAINQIIENAIKFKHPGREPKAWIEVLKSDSSTALLIGDNGIGIKKELSNQYFNMFFKGGNSSGNGIGLYIARKVIERLQGNIQISGNSEKGTTVRIDLPMKVQREIDEKLIRDDRVA